jgi:hypothetical protein
MFASRQYLTSRGRPKRLADLAKHDLIASQATTSGAVWELYTHGKRHRVLTAAVRTCADHLIERLLAVRKHHGWRPTHSDRRSSTQASNVAQRACLSSENRVCLDPVAPQPEPAESRALQALTLQAPRSEMAH